MKERNNKMELLGNAPIPKALMALGIPIMIGMLINALYNLVDAYFVGGLGESQMGAISIVFPLGQVVVGLGLMFGNGAASYLSRLLGRGDKDTANKVASTALYSSVLVGAIIIILATIFLKPILTLLGATDTIMPYALTYARIYVVSCIFNVFNVTMNNIVTSEGAAKTTMCALLLGAILNIGLDPIFIYVLEMGVAGAAIATAISQLVSTLVYLNYVLRKKSAFTFSVREFAPTKQMMAEILKIGVPKIVNRREQMDMKYDKMVALNQAKSRQKTDIAISEIEKMLQRKERISVTELARNTGFAKSFFYRNPEVRKALDDAQLQQGECYNPKKVIFDRALENTNINLKTTVMKLKKRIRELESENSRLEKKIEELTKELNKQKK